MISFPRGTEMFQFPRLPSWAYVFNPRQRRTTDAGLSHSEIHGSKAVQRLTVAYRSRPRPSSTPDAKASTVCPSYLDGDQLRRCPEDRVGAVIPNSCLAIGPPDVDWRTIAVQFSRSGGMRPTSRDSARRSLKTQQHAAPRIARGVLCAHPEQANAGPGPVDVLRTRRAERATSALLEVSPDGPSPRKSSLERR